MQHEVRTLRSLRDQPAGQKDADIGPAGVRRGESAVAPAPDLDRGRGLQQVIAKAESEYLSATFWTPELSDQQGDTVVVVRGHRMDVEGKPSGRDRFEREERLRLPPCSGPVSLSVKVHDVNPGQWSVRAEMVPARSTLRPGPKRATTKRARRGAPMPVATWSRRRLRDAGSESVTTTTALGIKRPGIVRGGWAAMVALGVVSALAVQQALFRLADLPPVAGLAVSLSAAVAGGVGAKLWYVFVDREHGRWNGWCIQGFVAALVPVLFVGGPAIGVPVGTFLDISTPPLFLGMAIGRFGCFVGGCCCGRPTASRLGVWSSDRRIGVRRIPTQLLEASLSLAVFAAALLNIVNDPRSDTTGALFIGAVAAYTLARQLLLRLRAEPRRTTLGTWAIGAAATVALVLVTIAVY